VCLTVSALTTSASDVAVISISAGSKPGNGCVPESHHLPLPTRTSVSIPLHALPSASRQDSSRSRPCGFERGKKPSAGLRRSEPLFPGRLSWMPLLHPETSELQLLTLPNSSGCLFG
jgi:hypothetical protein